MNVYAKYIWRRCILRRKKNKIKVQFIGILFAFDDYISECTFFFSPLPIQMAEQKRCTEWLKKISQFLVQKQQQISHSNWINIIVYLYVQRQIRNTINNVQSDYSLNGASMRLHTFSRAQPLFCCYCCCCRCYYCCFISI